MSNANGYIFTSLFEGGPNIIGAGSTMDEAFADILPEYRDKPICGYPTSAEFIRRFHLQGNALCWIISDGHALTASEWVIEQRRSGSNMQ